MGQPSASDSVQHEYGRRLLHNVVDQVAVSDPGRSLAFIPRSNEPKDGWKPVTYGEVANAVNYVAHEICKAAKDIPKNDVFPTVAYIGPNDIRYLVVMLACIKAHHKALFISPRNSLEGQLSLFEATACDIVYYADPFGPAVETWLRKRPTMRATKVAGADAWLQSNAAPFLYTRSFEQARFEPVVVLHTSGSTGHPKPVTIRHGSIAISDKATAPI